jgi:uncharacterized protein YndB with AHSA1/START domain
MFSWTMFLFLALLATPANAQSPMDRLQKLAADGKIDENAAVKASSEITIHASPENVWHLLTDIDNWPKWQSTISAAKINGPLESGSTFEWTNGGTEIKSRIALARPVTQLAWTGIAHKARAIHVWNLQPLPDGGTLVKTIESMDGFMLKLFYSSDDLAKSQRLWLDALKHRAEH